MNKARRRVLSAAFNQIAAIKDELERLEMQINDAQTEEEEARDNLPESLQDGEKGEVMQQAMDNMYLAIESIQSAMTELDTAMERLDEAQQ